VYEFVSTNLKGNASEEMRGKGEERLCERKRFEGKTTSFL